MEKLIREIKYNRTFEEIKRFICGLDRNDWTYIKETVYYSSKPIDRRIIHVYHRKKVIVICNSIGDLYNENTFEHIKIILGLPNYKIQWLR